MGIMTCQKTILQIQPIGKKTKLWVSCWRSSCAEQWMHGLTLGDILQMFAAVILTSGSS